MNTLLAWFNSPEWMIVVKTLLHTLWQAGGFALLLWFALRHAATPAARYRLTLGTLAAILGATLLTWAVLNQSSAKPAATDFASPTTPARKPSGVSPAANFGEPSVIAYSTPIAKPAEETRWSGWLALAWLLGSALMLTRAGIQVAGAERLRRSCKPLDDSRITQLLAEAQRALNLTRRIRVAMTDKLTSPAVVGVIVPTLILPLTLLSTLTPEQIRFILLHELAHIRRGDYFANLFQLFIEALLFFNPAVWWISHQVRREREACCDALAIELSGAPVDYARTLLHVAETVLNPPPAAAPAFSDNPREPSSLTDRVQRLLVPGYRPALRLTWRAMLAAIVVGGTLLFLSAVGARSTVGAVLSPKQSASENNLRTTTTNAADEILILTNSLELKLLGQKLIADFIEVNKTTGKVVARGNVRLETTNGTSYGDEFRSDNATNLEPGIIIVWDKAISPVPWTNPLPAGWMIDASTGRLGNQWFYYRVKPSTAETNSERTTTRQVSKPTGTHRIGSTSISFDNFNDGWFAPGEPRRTNPVKYINLSRPRYATGTRGGIIDWDNIQYADEPKTAPSQYYKSASDRITLFNYSNSHTPVVQLGTPSQPDTQAFVSSVQYYGDDGTNTQTFQPLESRVFTIDLNKYAAAVRKLAGMPESTPLSNTYPLFGMFLTNAGVKLDDRALGRTFFFSQSRGDVDIRATKDELDAIEKLLQPLAGVPLTHRTFQISPEILAMATNVLPRKISTILATNPVAGLQALLESFDPSDPRPKRVQYKPETGEITARATETDLKSFAAILDAVQAANSPSTPLINRLIVTSSLSQAKHETNSNKLDQVAIAPLQTRVFHVVPDTFIQALDSVTGLFPDIRSTNKVSGNQSGQVISALTRTNNSETVHAAVRKFFAIVGVTLDPSVGKTAFFNDREGSLYVRATRDELDIIEQVVRVLNTAPTMVNIKIRWVQIPKSLPYPDAWPLEFRSNNFSGILDQEQMAGVMKQIQVSDGINLLNEGQLTTLTERQAQISFAEMKTVVTGINPKALTKPGIVTTNNDASEFLQSETTPLGPVFDVLPTVSADGVTISLRLIATYTEFLGYDKAAKEIPFYVDGKKRKTTLPLPIYQVRQMTNDTVVPDGRTLILGNLPAKEVAKQPNGEMRTTDATSTQTNLLFILVTPTIIDPAGNPASSKK